MNLVVRKGLNDSRVQRAFRICRSAIAVFFRKKQRDLVIAQDQEKLKIHRLKLDIVTH